tara:strand:+ start:8491 stop:9777 length:1287 start_codon:yes stop_codon:yes gene_type:complete
MWLFLYNFFLNILYIPYILIILLRIFLNKEHKLKFKEKLFLCKIKRPAGSLFWFHVASIGELNSILPIVDYFLKKDKSYNFLITTVTLSSYNEFKKKFEKNPRVFHQFLPYDHKLLVNNFLELWKPDIASFVDSEIWPNFIFKIKKKNIPLVLLNARITKKTLSRWLFLKNFSEILFGFFSICIASSKETMENLSLLKAKKIRYYGNIKFCSKIKINSKLENDQFKNIKDNNIWCAVSTHEDEEIFCSEVHKIIKKTMQDSLCIIIPRHIDRINKIAKKLKKSGLKLQIKNQNDLIDSSADIVLVNYYGSVGDFLEKIKNVFVGKSLVKKLVRVGGQNPIEAAQKACFIFHGPFVYNFAEIYSYLKDKGFSQEINYPDELAKKLLSNFNNNEKVVDKKKLEDLNVYSDSIFKSVINEYEILINENFKA